MHVRAALLDRGAERERKERERQRQRMRDAMCMFVCVCVRQGLFGVDASYGKAKAVTGL